MKLSYFQLPVDHVEPALSFEISVIFKLKTHFFYLFPLYVSIS